MSTILDALKKVERERQPARGPLLDVPTPEEPKRRRRVSLGMIVACATLGFAAGVGLALWRNTAPVEIAAVPDAVDVPPQAEVAPPQPAAPAVAVVPAVPPQPAPEQVAAAEQPATGAANGEPAAPSAAEPEQVASARQADVPPPVESAPNAAAPAPNAPSAVEPEGSALEPSPFGPRRGGGAVPDAAQPRAVPPRAGTVVANAPRTSTGMPVPGAPPKAPQAPPPLVVSPNGEVQPLVLPPPEEAVEPEEEPEEAAPPPPQEKLFDTGRSPAGQPKVVLSFLQWSADPARRFAVISIEGAPSQRVQEGDTAGGMTVAAITPTGVRLKHDATVFTITPRH